MPESGAEILARIKPKLMEDWVGICLRPDLVADFEEADSELGQAKVEDAKRPPRAGSSGASAKTKQLERRVRKLKADIAKSEIRFVFRGLPRDQFRALCDEHPPRDGDQYDAYVGYNRTAVSDAMVQRCLVAPDFDDDSWAELLDVIGAGQWLLMQKTAEHVNGAVIQEPPKSQWETPSPVRPASG